MREEIERYEGRLRYLRNRAQPSMLTVTVHEAFPVVSARGETGVIGDAFKQAWRNFVGFIAGIISFMGILGAGRGARTARMVRLAALGSGSATAGSSGVTGVWETLEPMARMGNR